MGSTSVVPDLIDALFTKATDALEGVTVYDGFGVTNDPGDFLMIGVEDPDSQDAAYSAETEQDWAEVGANLGSAERDETGTLTCAALSWNGDANQKQARDAAYAITSKLEDLLRADPTLGLTSLLWTSFGTSSQLSQAQDSQGALALLVFRIYFRARI